MNDNMDFRRQIAENLIQSDSMTSMPPNVIRMPKIKAALVTLVYEGGERSDYSILALEGKDSGLKISIEHI